VLLGFSQLSGTPMNDPMVHCFPLQGFPVSQFPKQGTICGWNMEIRFHATARHLQALSPDKQKFRIAQNKALLQQSDVLHKQIPHELTCFLHRKNYFRIFTQPHSYSHFTFYNLYKITYKLLGAVTPEFGFQMQTQSSWVWSETIISPCTDITNYN